MVLLAGGGAAVVLVVAMVRRGSGSSTGSTTQTPNTYDSTLSDIEAQWENQFEALQNQIASQNGTPPSGGGGQVLPLVVRGSAPPRNVSVPPIAATLTAPPIFYALSRNTPASAAVTSAGMQRTYTASLSPAAKR